MSAAGGGLDPTTIKPPDAVAALRSFPRRWRSAFALVADDPGTDELVRRRPDASSWSVLEHARYVAEHLRQADGEVGRIAASERPSLSESDLGGHVDAGAGDGGAGPAGGGQDDDGLEAVLAQIGSRAPALAATLEGLAADDWLRTGERAGAEVTILAIAQTAVADAAEHLRAAERALRAAGGGN